VPDLKLPKMTPRHVAANVVLQLHGYVDPDTARALADELIFRIDRAGLRGHSESAATDDEVRRAHNSLSRHGCPCTQDAVRAALNDAFVYGWGQ
jgi:hypothetical protein